jgi:hypothetical protein
MHSRPYRNPRIIAVIRDLYFTGGHTSFACRFRYLFPQMELDNVVKYEVPVPMVALVATAVSYHLVCTQYANWTFSSTLLSMSGARESSKLLISLPIRTWTSIKAMSTP